MKQIKFTVYVTIGVDENNEMVRDYSSDKELVDELVSYQFSPEHSTISEGGVQIEEFFLGDIEDSE